MSKNITLRTEWVIAALALPTAAKHLVIEAILAYMVNGYISEITDSQASDVFNTIKADIDARAAKREAQRLARAKKAKAPKTPKTPETIPGYLPPEPPKDLKQRADADPLVRMALQKPIFAEFAGCENPLIAELCLQILDGWRTQRCEKLPSFDRLCQEFDDRFGEVILNIKPAGLLTRKQWCDFIARYDKQAA